LKKGKRNCLKKIHKELEVKKRKSYKKDFEKKKEKS